MLACCCQWALPEAGCSGASFPASVHGMHPLPSSLLLALSRPCCPCPALSPSGPMSCKAAYCGGDSPPSRHTRRRSRIFPAPPPVQLRAGGFYLLFQGKCSEPVLYLPPFSTQPQLPCLNFRLKALFSQGFVFVFLRGHQHQQQKGQFV